MFSIGRCEILKTIQEALKQEQFAIWRFNKRLTKQKSNSYVSYGGLLIVVKPLLSSTTIIQLYSKRQP